jgi:hypothetical protein
MNPGPNRNRQKSAPRGVQRSEWATLALELAAPEQCGPIFRLDAAMTDADVIVRVRNPVGSLQIVPLILRLKRPGARISDEPNPPTI